MDISEIVARQREYFNSGATRPLSFRLDALRSLKKALGENGTLIGEALMSDLRKSSFETYISETGLVLEEIGHHLKRLPRWIKNKRVPTPLSQFHAKSHLAPEPYGVALIVSPWNYPLQLCLQPLVGAISAGNCAVIKPSAYTPATSRAIAKLLADVFPAEYVAVVEGGRKQNKA
ncbi:MAG TPA: aldehyde dehydrogenase family protein, partial [Clostridia bacterium]|nr:aldehyde dehydrogenase family protein [Clostridia bacterium]